MKKQTGCVGWGRFSGVPRRSVSSKPGDRGGGARGTAHRSLFTGLLLAAGLLGTFAPRAQAVSATGGTVTNYTEGGTAWTAHIFTSSGTLTFGPGGEVEVLVVGGGGGGGGGNGGGGGGAGGVITNNYTVGSGEKTVTVGAGVGAGTTGNPSTFDTLTAGGGGAGGNANAGGGTGGTGATVGGSGGGCGRDNGASGLVGSVAGNGTTTFNNAGGSTSGGYSSAGGGGGAGGVGQNGYYSDANPIPAGYTGGGPGISSAFSGETKAYAGGGGGAQAWRDGGAGGSGIGGNGGHHDTAGGNATPNTGSGGGGGGTGGNGGSGIVIVRYVTPSDAPTLRNDSVTAVTTTSATFNGTLTSTGYSACAVCVLWGDQNGGQTWNWANTNLLTAPGGGWTNNSPLSKTITSSDGLLSDKTYYYTFAATNETTNAVASSPKSFITGEVTGEATDGTAQFPGNNGQFTIRRPPGCTNLQLTVNFTMGGTGVQNTDYTLSSSGSVTMDAGESNKLVTLTPLSLSAKTAILMLTAASANPYPLGTASDTVNIQTADVPLGGGDSYSYDPGSGKWTITFTTVGSEQITLNSAVAAEYLIVGGGGGGGNFAASTYWTGGGGGGGGKVMTNGAPVTITSGVHTVTVGGGGTVGNNGDPSSFGSLVTALGGEGGNMDGQGYGGDSGNGYNGGSPSTAHTDGRDGAGGGAGAKEDGDSNNSVGVAGWDGMPGGDGLDVSAVWGAVGGASGVFGGGGGGGTGYQWSSNTDTSLSPGGSGGGGRGGGSNGSWSGQPIYPVAGTANTGGGGGGGGNGSGSTGTAGGSGIVIIRCKVLSPVGTLILLR